MRFNAKLFAWFPPLLWLALCHSGLTPSHAKNASRYVAQNTMHHVFGLCAPTIAPGTGSPTSVRSWPILLKNSVT